MASKRRSICLSECRSLALSFDVIRMRIRLMRVTGRRQERRKHVPGVEGLPDDLGIVCGGRAQPGIVALDEHMGAVQGADGGEAQLRAA
jgi:hypothetical protein